MPQWLLFALLSAFFAAITAVFAKAGLKEVNPDLATAIRTAIILFITWGIVFLRVSARRLGVCLKTIGYFLGLSALATSAYWLFYYRALQMGKASEVSIIDRASILFTIVLAFVCLKNH